MIFFETLPPKPTTTQAVARVAYPKPYRPPCRTGRKRHGKRQAENTTAKKPDRNTTETAQNLRANFVDIPLAVHYIYSVAVCDKR